MVTTEFSSRSSEAPARKRRADDQTVELVEQLKNLVTEQLEQRLGRMFDGADDMLFEMAGRAKNNDEQRVFFDTMRVVRLNRPGIARVFGTHLKAGSEPGAEVAKPQEDREISFDEIGMAESKSVEETIAITNMITKAEGLCQRPLWEVGRRLDWLIHERHAPISRHALSPTLFCNAFRQGAESLNVDFPIELAIYKLFDRQVISQLPEVYAAILRFFETHGVQAVAVGSGVTRTGGATGASNGARPAAAPPAPQADPLAAMATTLSGRNPAGPSPMAFAPPPPMMPAMAQPGAHMQGMPGYSMHGPSSSMPAMPVSMASGALPPLPQMGAGSMSAMASHPQLPAVDSHTLHALHYLQSAPAVPGEGYSDPQLAADLSRAAEGGAVAGWSLPQAFSYVQRTGLVGRMFNDILSDPNLPPNLKPQFDQLRFSVIKSALKDSSFFANPAHPVRGLVNDLATMAASARATGMESIKRIEDLVAKIQGQFDEAAHTVTAAPEKPEPLPEQEIERFLDQQLVQSKNRRRSIIEKARRVVSEELQLRLVGLNIPASAKPLLQSGWAPMMSLILLRHGMDSDPWREGILTFRRIVNALDPMVKAARSPTERDELCADIEEDLIGVEMPAGRIRELLQGFREALESVDHVVKARTPQKTAAASAAEESFDDAEANAAVAAALAQAALAPNGVTPKPDLASPMLTPVAATPTPLPDSPAALLDLLLVPGSWFHVYDHDHHETRWLKVVAHYQEHDRPAYRDSVAFAEFNGRNTLMIKTDVLLEDLVSKRSEPFDQSPVVKEALQRFTRLQANAPAAEALH
ncbi:MAG TPA: DUF1631 family protein [Solimonas sp.]|nr:DUF1631 family protein [Solimonas sp.]